MKNLFRIFRLLTPWLCGPRRRRPPSWRDDFEQIPVARCGRTRRRIIIWPGTQVLPILVTIEDPELDWNSGRR